MARSAAALWFCVAVSRALAASSGEAKVLLRRRRFSRYCGSNPEQQQQAHCFRTEGYHRGLLTPASATAAASAPGACTSGTCSTGSCALTERTALGPPLSELRRPSSLTQAGERAPALPSGSYTRPPAGPPALPRLTGRNRLAGPWYTVACGPTRQTVLACSGASARPIGASAAAGRRPLGASTGRTCRQVHGALRNRDLVPANRASRQSVFARGPANRPVRRSRESGRPSVWTVRFPLARVDLLPGDVDIVVSIDVDVGVSATPAWARPTPQTTNHRSARRERHPGRQCGAEVITGRWRQIDRRVRRIGPRAIHRRRIVARHVNHVGVGGLDDDRLLLLTYDLLWTGLQIASALCLPAETLD